VVFHLDTNAVIAIFKATPPAVRENFRRACDQGENVREFSRVPGLKIEDWGA
jgi:predicted nucleic acid-binding protein